jgi:hypothetical protein
MLSNRDVYLIATLLVLGITKEAFTDSIDNVNRSDAVLRCEIRGSKGNKEIGPGEHIQFALYSNQDGLKVFQDWNSWGYFARSFDARENGMQDKLPRFYRIQRWARPWAGNGPTTDIVNAGRLLITDINLCDGTWYSTPSLPDSASLHLVLNPIFEIEPNTDAARLGVWTGRITGEPKEILIEKDCIVKLRTP